MKNIKKLLRIFDRKYRKTEEIFLKILENIQKIQKIFLENLENLLVNLENLLENLEKFRKINSYFVLN